MSVFTIFINHEEHEDHEVIFKKIFVLFVFFVVKNPYVIIDSISTPCCSFFHRRRASSILSLQSTPSRRFSTIRLIVAATSLYPSDLGSPAASLSISSAETNGPIIAPTSLPFNKT